MGSHDHIDKEFPSQLSFSGPNSRYKSPENGLMSHVPTSWLPFAELMRLDRPNGFWYFYLPHLYGTLHAAKRLGSSYVSLLQTNMIVILGTVVMRGATCLGIQIIQNQCTQFFPLHHATFYLLS